MWWRRSRSAGSDGNRPATWIRTWDRARRQRSFIPRQTFGEGWRPISGVPATEPSAPWDHYVRTMTRAGSSTFAFGLGPGAHQFVGGSWCFAARVGRRIFRNTPTRHLRSDQIAGGMGSIATGGGGPAPDFEISFGGDYLRQGQGYAQRASVFSLWTSHAGRGLGSRVHKGPVTYELRAVVIPAKTQTTEKKQDSGDGTAPLRILPQRTLKDLLLSAQLPPRPNPVADDRRQGHILNGVLPFPGGILALKGVDVLGPDTGLGIPRGERAGRGPEDG